MEDFVFNESALFYKYNAKFSEINFEQILKKLTPDKKKCIYNFVEEKNYKYIFFAFKTFPKYPTFYEGDNTYWKESKAAYIIIIYNNDYAAILKQNTTIPTSISQYLIQIDYSDILKIFVQSDTEYKHLSMRNIDGSDTAIRSKSYDAVNLKQNISSVNAYKYLIQNMRGKNKKESFALCTSTSRVNQYKSKRNQEKIVKWVLGIFNRLDKIDSTKQTNDFLSRFAQHVELSKIQNLQPSSILLYTQSFLDILNNVSKDSKTIAQKIMRNIPKYELAYNKIIKSNDEFIFSKDKTENIVLKIKKNKIYIKNDLWKKCKLSDPDNDDNGERDLEEYINKNNLFSVFFEDASYTYSNGRLFYNNRLINDMDALLEYCEKQPKLNAVTCEKFIGKPSTSKKRKWEENSEFKIMVEEYSNKHACFICDDCKTEWADFIGLDEKQVTFYACKYDKINNDSSSASNFHDVVSQALKNLGNLSPTSSQLYKKRKNWKGTYLKSSIKRCILPNTKLDQAVDGWEQKHHQPNFKKVSALVVNFISYDGLKQRIEHLQNHFNHSQKDTLLKDETTFQQIWLLSSFVSTCLEAGVTPKIICSE